MTEIERLEKLVEIKGKMLDIERQMVDLVSAAVVARDYSLNRYLVYFEDNDVYVRDDAGYIKRGNGYFIHDEYYSFESLQYIQLQDMHMILSDIMTILTSESKEGAEQDE